ncbi:GD15529 [Drosophila simulans]|uniref:GD15529 n=1 Tax=Drosophila simulans TaxID=7240 RepID=B4R3A4_DROSI|nr:GD15529 [Drosophila simulans]
MLSKGFAFYFIFLLFLSVFGRARRQPAKCAAHKNKNTRNDNNNRDWSNQFDIASLRLTKPAGHSLGTKARCLWEPQSRRLGHFGLLRPRGLAIHGPNYGGAKSDAFSTQARSTEMNCLV